jgi:hypothetical protein
VDSSAPVYGSAPVILIVYFLRVPSYFGTRLSVNT